MFLGYVSFKLFLFRIIIPGHKIATAMAESVAMTDKNDPISLSPCIMHFELAFFDGCNARIVDKRHIPA